MVDIQEYISKSTGNWLRATHVQTGDMLTILGEGEIDDTTFDKAYLNIPTKLERTGEPYTVRLGTKNVARIAETLGGNTSKWVGNSLEVLSIENYAGLGQKGVLFKGVKAAKQEKISGPFNIKKPAKAEEPGLGTVLTIRQAHAMVEAGIAMSGTDWDSYIKPDTQGELLALGLVEARDGKYFFTEKAKQYLEK